jgi:hypothetical protein
VNLASVIVAIGDEVLAGEIDAKRRRAARRPDISARRGSRKRSHL